MENSREKDKKIVNLGEYKRRREHQNTAEEAEQEDAEKVLKEVSYHLVMAARAIADQHGKRKKP